MEITEQPGPATAALDRLSTEEIVALINTEDAAVAAAVRTALPEIARTVDLIADRLRHGGRLIYVGAGTSGRIGLLDAAEWGPAFGTPLRTLRRCWPAASERPWKLPPVWKGKRTPAPPICVRAR